MGHEFRIHVVPAAADIRALVRAVVAQGPWSTIESALIETPDTTAVGIRGEGSIGAWPQIADLQWPAAIGDARTPWLDVLAHTSDGLRFVDALTKYLRQRSHAVTIEEL